MDFGRVDIAELSGIDFTLPSEPATNAAILATGKGNTKYFIGTASTKDKMNIYARQFNAIELNAPYYAIPTLKQVELWRIAVPDGFKYFSKFPQTITHVKRLKDVETTTTEFLQSIKELGDKLGGFFLMPHPQLNVSGIGLLREFISTFPKEHALYLEVRHPDWYKSRYNNELLDLLMLESRGTVITDAAGRRDAVHMHLSKPECFIRFVGNGLHDSDYSRIDEWVTRLKGWSAAGLEQCNFFIHQQEYPDAVELLNYFKTKLYE